MSLRAELVRLGVRWWMKRTARDATVGRMRRRCLAGAAFIPNPPAGTRIEAIDLGGIKAERATTPVSQHNRNVLYLHGGGYVSGSFVCYRHLTSRIAWATRASVLIIDYRL